MSLILLRGLSWVLNRLPRKWLHRLGDGFGWFVFACLKFRRDIVLDNLKLAFGDQFTPEERNKLALKNYQHYGRTFFEILLSINWTAEDFRKNVVVEGLDHVRAAAAAGTGAFLLTGHLGNWEWAITAATAQGLPIDVVVKKIRIAAGEKLMQWYRRKTGAGILLETGTAKDILRSLSRGRLVGFILDQFMGPPIGLPVKFFGQSAGTAVAVALLTEKRNVPVLPVSSYRDEKGTVHVVFDPPLVIPPLADDKGERLFQKTQLYNNALEMLIRRHPEQWLWLHRRWKAYQGQPRWMPKAAAVTAVFIFCLLLGTVARGQSETGIPIPPDPVIAVPAFGAPRPAVQAAGPVSFPARVASPGIRSDNPEVLSAEKIPFAVGEKLDLDLTWTALPAGRAVMEVREGPAFNNRPTFQLWGNVVSSRLVDAFYHVDNSVESYVDKTGLVPYKFLLHMVESFQKKETRVSFDHVKNQAFYWAKRISSKWGNQDINRSDGISPRAMDMFSAIYYARTLDYALNQKQVYPVYENGQNFQVELVPVGNELVKTKAGVFQCWKIRAQVAVNNLLRPTGESYLWLSDDSKKYIVKFESKLKYGALTGSLVNIQDKL